MGKTQNHIQDNLETAYHMVKVKLLHQADMLKRESGPKACLSILPFDNEASNVFYLDL